jgi:hypothetical protein
MHPGMRGDGSWPSNAPLPTPLVVFGGQKARSCHLRKTPPPQARFASMTSPVRSSTPSTPGQSGHARWLSTKFGALIPGVSNLVLVLPGGVGRAGASAKAAQGTPPWATLSTGPKTQKRTLRCHGAWGALNYQNIDSTSYREGGVQKLYG